MSGDRYTDPETTRRLLEGELKPRFGTCPGAKQFSEKCKNNASPEDSFCTRCRALWDKFAG